MQRNLEVMTLGLLLLISVSSAAGGSAYIYASAVTALGVGNLTTISLNVTPGNGNVLIKGPSSVANDTLFSAQEAVGYAANYLKLNPRSYNFTYFVNYSSVSGPSGGLALSVLAISALSSTPLQHNFALTGTVTTTGNVGQIGGIYEKSLAAVQSKKQFMIVPYALNGTFENSLYYIVQQRLGIPVVKVSNVTQALPYAFGTAKPRPFSYNITQNYHTSLLPTLNLTCQACNTTKFKSLAYTTINLTTAQVAKILGNYSALRGSLTNSLANFTTITNKGYLYTGADLSFLEFSNAYLFANSNFTRNAATTIIANVTNYCNSLSSPAMTSDNYEYVIGGQLRQGWALQTLNNSRSTLASAQTTDDVAQSIYGAATSYAWCTASSKMYKIALGSNSAPVALSNSTIQLIYKSVNASQKYPGLYSQVALSSLNAGKYGAALYNSRYAAVFGNSTFSLYSQSQLSNLTQSNIMNASNGGIWPFEFSAQSLFFLNQALLQQPSGGSLGAMQNAYTISALALGLSSANNVLRSGFIAAPIVPYTNSTTVLNLQSQVSQIYNILFVLCALVFIIFLILIAMFLRPMQSGPIKSVRRPRRQ
ncbi:MAG: hypothetical protein KGH53_03880 [Candidatus Micrarchaeota archaeon]|nr:hypothetical protein [Candidatus Micrarchaeota archaeon]